MAEDRALAERLEHENRQLENNVPHSDRRRAGNMLEAIEDWNNNRGNGLADSVVLLDHMDADGIHMQ